MDANLARVFIQRGIIRQGTVLEAYQSAKGLSCVYDSYVLIHYVVISASANQDSVFFDVVSSSTDRQKIPCDYVAKIDGMAIKRVAAAHRLHEDGRAMKSRRNT